MYARTVREGVMPEEGIRLRSPRAEAIGCCELGIQVLGSKLRFSASTVRFLNC